MGKEQVPTTVVSRRRFLTGVGANLATAGLVLEGLFLEPNRLAVTRHRIGIAQDSTQTPLRLAVLTDLHLRSIGRLEEAVAEQLGELAPDVILIVGDAVDREDTLPLLEDFLGLLPSRTPKYATLGNWEHWSGIDLAGLAASYDRFSGRLLVNEFAEVIHQEKRAVLVGVDSLVGGRPDLPRALSAAGPTPNALLLSHCPAHRDMLGTSGHGLTAMFSGHTHGGQVALGRWAPVRPQGSGSYVSGWYRDGPLDLFVSRGIGTSVIPVRLGSVPELAYVEWFLESA